MFSGEFDRGTIKNLLTRPITRTDFFLSKGSIVVALGTFFFHLFAADPADADLTLVEDAGVIE